MRKNGTKNFDKTKFETLFWQNKDYINYGNIADIIAVKNDLKPLFTCILGSKDKAELWRKNCKKIKLILEYKRYKVTIDKKYNQFFHSPKKFLYNIYISKDPELIQKAKDATLQGFILNQNFRSEDFGLLLGYPTCCVENYLKGENTIESLKPYISNKIPFYNNNLLSNSISNCYLSTYEACSYNCKKTTQSNKKILTAIKREAPDYYKFLIKYLKKPLLVWVNNQLPKFRLSDSLITIVFDGALKNGMLKYKKIYPHFPINRIVKLINSPSKKDLDLLNEGSKLLIKQKYIKVYKNNSLIHKIKRSKYSAILVQPT